MWPVLISGVHTVAAAAAALEASNCRCLLVSGKKIGISKQWMSLSVAISLGDNVRLAVAYYNKQ